MHGAIIAIAPSAIIYIPISNILAKETYLGGRFGGRQQRELIVFLALAANITKRSVCLKFAPHEQDIGLSFLQTFFLLS